MIEALCTNCGKNKYPKAKKEELYGITVYDGICPLCKKKKTLIPIRDWEYASGKSLIWD